MQPVYVYFEGYGTSTYFTAPNEEEAIKFLNKENISEGSAFRTIVQIQSTRSYWLRNGISIANTNNLIQSLEDYKESIESNAPLEED